MSPSVWSFSLTCTEENLMSKIVKVIGREIIDPVVIQP